MISIYILFHIQVVYPWRHPYLSTECLIIISIYIPSYPLLPRSFAACWPGGSIVFPMLCAHLDNPSGSQNADLWPQGTTRGCAGLRSDRCDWRLLLSGRLSGDNVRVRTDQAELDINFSFLYLGLNCCQLLPFGLRRIKAFDVSSVQGPSLRASGR